MAKTKPTNADTPARKRKPSKARIEQAMMALGKLMRGGVIELSSAREQLRKQRFNDAVIDAAIAAHRSEENIELFETPPYWMLAVTPIGRKWFRSKQRRKRPRGSLDNAQDVILAELAIAEKRGEPPPSVRELENNTGFSRGTISRTRAWKQRGVRRPSGRTVSSGDLGYIADDGDDG